MGYCPYLSVLKIKEIVTPERDFLTTGDAPPTSGDDPLLKITGVTSTVIYDDELTHFDCLGSDCHLWDTVENECSIVVAAKVARHNHDQHNHPYSHQCNERFDDPSCGASYPYFEY